jgi:signal transduction histidine kinase
VILLSAQAEGTARRSALDAGADDYVLKPFSAQELIARVGAHARLARERARLLATEREARKGAEEANRAKSDFLAAMSHELRTPLNAIAGHAQLMEMGIHGVLTEAQRVALGRIQRSEQHLLSLINDVLNFAKLEAGRVEYDVEDVALAEVAAEVLSMVDPQLRAKGIATAMRVPEAAVARGDREKVRQILLNLLSNAIKFTNAGGQITIDAPMRDRGLEAPGAPVRTDASPLMVYLRVSDTGIGIARDKQESIFDPFVQIHRALTHTSEGTGLGLAISRDLAHGMHGELRVRSEVGQGSAFTLALPRAG